MKQPNNWVTWLRDRIPVAAGHYRQLRDDEYRWAMVISGVSDLQLLSDVNEAIDGNLYPPGTIDYDGEGYPPSEYFCHCVITMVPLSEANRLPHSTPPRSRPGRAPHDRAVVLGRLLDQLPDDAKSKFRQYVRQNQETIEAAIVEGSV